MPHRKRVLKKGKVEVMFDILKYRLYLIFQRPLAFNLVIFVGALALLIFTTTIQEKGINRYYLQRIKYWNKYDKRPFGLDLVDVPIYVDKIGTEAWISKNHSSHFRKSFSKCILCNYTTTNPDSNSTPRDLLFTISFTRIFHTLTYVRTFRSTGCKASLIIFIDERAYSSFTTMMINAFEQCGVGFINLGDIDTLYFMSITESRFVIFYAFLRKYYKDFDRVMTTDMSDTFFQTDPFSKYIVDDKLIIFSTECVDFSQSSPNRAWVEGADPDYDVDFYKDKLVVNGGFFIGKTKAVLIFLSEFINFPQFYDFYTEHNDQGLLNYLIYKKKLDKAGLIVNTTRPDEIYKSLTNCRFRSITAPEDDLILEESTKPLSILHQFDRFCVMLNVVRSRCPPINEDHLEPFGDVRHSLDQFCNENDYTFRYIDIDANLSDWHDDEWWYNNDLKNEEFYYPKEDQADKVQNKDLEDDKKFE